MFRALSETPHANGAELAGTMPPSPLCPSKRSRQTSPDRGSPKSPASEEDKAVGQSSNFRNVSACNRCRLRKNRCDTNLPSCASCDKAGVPCVGYDPITKREIPRSYVFYLETRVERLERLLCANNITYPSPERLDCCIKAPSDTRAGASPTTTVLSAGSEVMDIAAITHAQNEEKDRTQIVTPRAGMAAGATTGPANPRYLGSTTGVTFAKVVFAAVQSSVSDHKSVSDKAGVRPYKPTTGPGTSMRDCFFGLHTKPTIHPATFPDKPLGLKLAHLYFEHANPQIPVLHREIFLHMFEQAYQTENCKRGPKELYMLNMVFAIGGGIIMGDAAKSDPRARGTNEKPQGMKQCQPEEYHASAIVHLEACLSNSGDGLEELQAVLLLASFALLRPVPPGLWYIIGVAVRLAVDLGLHCEDGKDPDPRLGDSSQWSAKEREECGRREYVRDMRRRLWWCTYSLDRLVCVCVGRPPGISDQPITTEFPSLFDDRFISPTAGVIEPPAHLLEPTYKHVSHHYFRLRLLQSEILQVLQYQQAQVARQNGQNQRNPSMLTWLPSPFLAAHKHDFRRWRIDVDRRLYEWKNAAPSKTATGVGFSVDFLELNYWQAIVMLYRQSLSVPAMFEGEYNTAREVNSPTVHNTETREDEDRVYLKVAEAGQKILRLYRQLHIVGLINYTYLATHYLFMAGISYLYAIWHSPVVRSRLSMDEVDFTILSATSVFTDLVEICPPAEACRDAFDRTAKATIKMANQNGGFGADQKPSELGMYVDAHHRGQWPAMHDGASSFSREPPGRKLSSGRPAYDAISDSYSVSASAAQLSALQKYARTPLPVKTESSDSFGLFHKMPMQPRSNNDKPLAPDSGLMDTRLTASPRQTTSQMGSPIGQQPLVQQALANLQQGHHPKFPDGSLDYTNSMELMGFQDFDGDMNLNFGMGLGWEGLRHDFSDGQPVDLFDGFFFGGQQNGNGQASNLANLRTGTRGVGM